MSRFIYLLTFVSVVNACLLHLSKMSHHQGKAFINAIKTVKYLSENGFLIW